MTPSEVLTRALMELANRGGRPRCGDPLTHDYWLSEDPAERALAAIWCGIDFTPRIARREMRGDVQVEGD